MRKLLSAAVLILVSTIAQAQITSLAASTAALASPAGSGAQSPNYYVIDRGPHWRTWAQTFVEPTALGGTVIRTNLTYELATGMHFLETNGIWAESREEFSILPDGTGAVALQGQHKVFVPADLYEDCINITLPSGETMRTRPVAISYWDGTNNVLIGEITNSVGQLSGDGRSVTWPSTFTDVRADIVATYRRGSFECDLVLREQLPTPLELGLSENCRLQLLTECFDTPDPAQDVETAGGPDPSALPASQLVGTNATPESITLHFGGMRMPSGKAFFVGSQVAATNSYKVRKSWVHYQARKFLLEDLDYRIVKLELSKLQASASPLGGRAPASPKLREDRSPRAPFSTGPDREKLLTARSRPTKGQYFPPLRAVGPGERKLELARADAGSPQGFILDYELQGSVSSFALQSDRQYLVTGPFHVSGILTVEGGSVTRFTNSPNAKISFSGPLACRTDFYKPAVFSCQNDDSPGSPAPFSTGTPGPIAATYLEDVSDADNAYRHLRFSYAGKAVSVVQGFTGNEFWHCQFVRCSNAVNSVSSKKVRLFNVLASGCGTVLNTCYSFSAQHVTCDQSGTFGSSILYPGSSGLTNCILTGLTNLNSSFALSSSKQASSGAGIYQLAGACGYYLLPGDCVNTGTTNVHPALLADLKRLTTSPPVVYSDVTNTVDQTFYPQAQRDTDAPDLGWHAPPLDYCFGGVGCEANLTFGPGTAVGWFRISSGSQHAGYGIHLGDGKTLTFNGTMEAPCYWARYNVVQEQSNTNWAGGSGPGGITGWASTLSASPQVQARFTRCSALAGESGTYFRDDAGYLTVRATHCEFWGGGLGGYSFCSYYTNCLMDRVSMWLQTSTSDSALALRNCTLHGGAFTTARASGGSAAVSVRDCIFDGTTNSTADAYSGNSTLSDYSHNAFVTGNQATTPQGAGIVWVPSFNWVRGALGWFYVPTNSPVVNAGSQGAPNAALYHFTMTSPKETNTTVEIGYHVVAVTNASAPTVWVDDSIPPSTIGLNNDQWTWTNNPSPVSGSYCHVSSNVSSWHQHYFYNSSVTWTLGPLDTIFCYIYLNPTNLPSEVMLQWQVASPDPTYWYHRAFWGDDSIQGWGTRTYMGPLPAAGGWVRLEVPAREVDLAGRIINGMAFTLNNACAAWDYAGQVGVRSALDFDGDTLPDYLENFTGSGTNNPAAGETDWQTYTSRNGLNGASGLEVFTPLR